MQASFRAIGEYPELEAMADAANPMGRLGNPYDNTLFVDGGSHINGVAWAPDLDNE